MTRLIDLTRPLEVVDETSFPPVLKPLLRILTPTVDFVDNAAGATVMKAIFGCADEDLPEGEGWAEESLTISSHLGTHLDAPLHYGSTCGGSRSRTVEQIDLQELFMNGVVLDLTAKKGSSSAITVDDLRAALDKIDYQIQPGDAVLIRTDHDKYELTDPVRYNYPGLIRESASWLADSGAKVGGTDALGWDRPFHVMVAEFKKTGDKSHIWDAHFAHRDKEFFVVQQLVNLDSLPPVGFKLGIFPLKLVGTSAAPARVVAFID